MIRRPTYLRVVLTESCTMACGFCHAEGLKLPPELLEEDVLAATVTQALQPIGMGTPGMGARRHHTPLSLDNWKTLLGGALASGVQKVKFLGGEPLVMRHLPALIQWVKQQRPEADVSLISSGAAPLERLKACFDAGLDRANLSIHGFELEAFARNAPSGAAEKLFAMRQAVLHHLLERGRALKLNYVYTGPQVEADLKALLRWATSQPVTVSVLDDLNRHDYGPETIRAVLRRLQGPADRITLTPDPHSLPTELWTWNTGLSVEIKSTLLGEVAPWEACTQCPRKSICREGIFALRVDPNGTLRGCVDRPDRAVSVREVVTTTPHLMADAWLNALDWIDQPHDDRFELVYPRLQRVMGAPQAPLSADFDAALSPGFSV